VIAAVLAWQFFGEQLTLARVLGIGIILLGVAVLARG
jgi:multidrug transporter EmrE-like cation transporter